MRSMGRVARPYALALFAVAHGRGSSDVVEGEMHELRARLHSAPDLARLLRSPQLSAREKREVVDRTLAHGASDLVADFLRLLVDKKRMSALDQIASQYIDVSEKSRGVVRGTVTTAVPLHESDRDVLVQKLQKRTGGTVVLTERVDASLLGGVVVKLRDTLLDHSVRRRLEEVRHALLSARVHT